MWQTNLITLYCAVCENSSTIEAVMQRQSNNFRPQFTDEECITVYLWGISQRRFEQKAIYNYTKNHLLEWFPKLPSYQAFSDRLNRLAPAFQALAESWLSVIGVNLEEQKDEPGALVEMIKRNDFNRKTIIVLDRGYESYNVMAHLMNTPNVYFVLRVKHNHSAMREIARLPMLELDCDIAFTISTTQTNEDKRNRHIYLPQPKKSKPGSTTRRARWDFPSPYTMRLRIVRFQLDNGNFETLATSLPRTFTIDDLKEIYHRRWGIETSFRDLKYSAGLVNLHGKRDDFVEQEIYAALTAFNFTSRIVQETVVQQPTDGLYAYAVNFKMAVTLCKSLFKIF